MTNPEVCFYGDSKFIEVDNEDEASQLPSIMALASQNCQGHDTRQSVSGQERRSLDLLFSRRTAKTLECGDLIHT